MTRGNSRSTYEPLTSTSGDAAESCGDDNDDVNDDVEALQCDAPYNRRSLEDDAGNQSETSTLIEDSGERLTVVILDYTQKKFSLSVPPSSNVQTLKREGAAIHKIAADRQRLIFRGRMLADDMTLPEAGIVEEGAIVHLFPKPRVVIKDSTDTEAPPEETDEDAARVPTIVLDADEAERRSQILVLGSNDFLEAQNSVKLFSFMLLIISAIELMSLLAIALGVPQEASDTVYPGEDDVFGPMPPSPDVPGNSTDPSGDTSSDGNSVELRHWTIENSLDFVVSSIGVYVALLGLKASNQTTLRLAKQYLYGTVVAGVCWMLFQYLMTYELDKTQFEERHRPEEESNADIMQAALSVMVLPGMVWFLCIVRAWQFQYLLEEAEREAEERIQNELENIEGPASTSGGNVADEELALQNEGATIT